MDGCINNLPVQHRSERRSATGTREGRRSLDLRWFSQVEDLSFTPLPILCFPWDQEGPGSTAVFSSCPIYLLSLYKIHSKWFSLNFSPFIFSPQSSDCGLLNLMNGFVIFVFISRSSSLEHKVMKVECWSSLSHSQAPAKEHLARPGTHSMPCKI